MIDEKHNPWTVTGQKQTYDNPWINVTEYDIINPSGGKGIYGKVHFKNFAIGILPLDDQLNTWLVGQYRFPLDQYSWEIPEGGGALELDPLESARRELLEETGLEAKDWQVLLKMHLSNSVTDELAIVYLARNLEQHNPDPEETEQLVVKKLPFEEVYRMVEMGEITDSLTVTSILKTKLLLLNGQIA
jgi:8-oxo-dGTP pyrophosphatase MutT (NUDIX family)